MKLSVGTLRGSSNFHTGQPPPVGMRALTPDMSCTTSETTETSSESSMGTLLHRQAGLASWMTCIVPFPTVASFSAQGFAAQRCLMAMTCGDTLILERWDLRMHGFFLDLQIYIPPQIYGSMYVCMMHLMFKIPCRHRMVESLLDGIIGIP